MTTETRKWFALEVARNYLDSSYSMQQRGGVANQAEIVSNGKSSWFPTLEYGRCILMFDGQRAILKHADWLHWFSFSNWREAVPFAEAWAAWSEAQ